MLFCCIQLILRMDTLKTAMSPCCCQTKNFKKVRGTFYLLWREPNGLWTFVCKCKCKCHNFHNLFKCLLFDPIRWLWIVFSVHASLFLLWVRLIRFSLIPPFLHTFLVCDSTPLLFHLYLMENGMTFFVVQTTLKEMDGQYRNDSSIKPSANNSSPDKTISNHLLLNKTIKNNLLLNERLDCWTFGWRMKRCGPTFSFKWIQNETKW